METGFVSPDVPLVVYRRDGTPAYRCTLYHRSASGVFLVWEGPAGEGLERGFAHVADEWGERMEKTVDPAVFDRAVADGLVKVDVVAQALRVAALA